MRVPLAAAKMATILGTALAMLGGSAAAAGVTGVRLTAATASSPWSQTDYNAAQSRANLTEQTLTPATAGQIRYLRSVVAPPLTGGCIFGPGVTAPVLTDNSLYAVMDGRLTKYDPATGAIIWRRNPDPSFSHVYPSLAVAGGLVVVGELDCGSESSPTGIIRAFDATTGAPVWSRQMPEFGALNQLVVSNGLVVAAGASDNSGLVITVRKLATGAGVWTRNQGCILLGQQLMVVHQVVITPSCTSATGAAVGRNLTTGAVLWRRSGNWVLQRGDSDATDGRHVFATNPGGTVVSLNPLTGKTQYTLAGATQVLAVDGSQAYAACNPAPPWPVCAYDSATGGLRWQVSPGLGASPALAAEAGGVLYLDQAGFALDTSTGKTLSRLWTFDATPTSLVVGDGRIGAVIDPRVLDLYGLPGS